MKATKIMTIALSAALMSSCGLYKNYERPTDIHVDGIYGNAQNGGEQGLGDLQWRQIFTDPALQSLIEKTLAHNSNMLQADLAIQQAEAGLRCAKLAYIPSIAFAPSGTLSGGKIWNAGTETKLSLGKTYSLPLSASWQIGSIGGLRNSKKKAQTQLAQTQVVKDAIQTNLVANVANLYYTLCMLDEQKRISQENVQSWKLTVDQYRHLMSAGMANDMALASMESNYYAISTSVLDIEQSILEIENVLSALVGDAPGHITRGSIDTWRAPSVITTGVPLQLLSRRPDVRQAELELASAFYDKNIAKSKFYPSLTISGNAVWSNSSTSMGVLDPGSLIASAVASLAQPIFANGAIRAQYKISKLQMQSKTIAFQQSLLDAGQEVNTAMAAVKNAQAKKPLITQQVQACERALRQSDYVFREGGISNFNYLQVINAKTSLLSAQINEASNKLAEIQATINLYQALGGGVR